MRRRLLRAFVHSALAALLAGCLTARQAIPPPAPDAVRAATPTALPTAAPSATTTPPPAPTASPARTSTPTPTTPPSPTATTAPIATGTATRAPASATPAARSATPPEIVRGDAKSRRIALTFDAGASAEPTPKILAALRQTGVRATMFLTGRWAEQNPALVRQIVAEGHELGNHSLSHPDFAAISDQEILDELAQTEAIISKTCGKSSKPYFRPPYGSRNPHVLAVAWGAGYRSVYWALDSGDWVEGAKTEAVIEKVLGKTQNGDVVVMHLGSAATAEGLPRILQGLRDKGFEPVTVSELLTDGR